VEIWMKIMKEKPAADRNNADESKEETHA